MKKKIMCALTLITAGVSAFFIWKNYSPENKEVIAVNKQAVNEDVLDEIGPKTAEPAADTETEKSNSSAGTKEDADLQTAPGIIDKLVSWGFEKASGRTVEAVIIHSSYDAMGNNPFDLEGLLAEYKSYGVAAHYLIDREGRIYRLVEEKDIAYHAGESRTPDGRSGVNDFSIGIELMNTKDGKFTEEQYDSLNDLLGYIKGRNKIKYVLGHNQIAPGRKDDPWNFDWKKVD
jgi:N-acetyl-anhydromuramyl-L-alanine amidase AmpD